MAFSGVDDEVLHLAKGGNVVDEVAYLLVLVYVVHTL